MSLDTMTPADPCGDCGFDHSREYEQAVAEHNRRVTDFDYDTAVRIILENLAND